MYKRQFYQITLFLLIALLLHNSAGCFLVFKLKQLAIQERMDPMAIWHRIMHSDEEIQLQTISFKTTEQANIHWLSKGKEFFLNGKHYDIVKTEKTDERCTYLCIADEEEDELFDSFDKYNTSDDLSVTKNKSAIKTICPVYPCFFTNKEKLIFYLTILSVFDTNATLNYYPLVYMEVNHPPPSFI